MREDRRFHSTLDVGPRLQLGEALVAKDLVSDGQLEEALALQTQRGHKKLLGEILVELGFVTAEQVMEVLAEGYGVPFVTQTSKIADPKVVEL